MKAAGVRTTFDDYIQLWAVGVRPDYVRKMRAAGYVFRDADQLVEMQALGLGPRDLNLIPPKPPRPAKPPRAPTVYPDRDPDGG